MSVQAFENRKSNNVSLTWILPLLLLAANLPALGPDGSGSLEIGTDIAPWHQTIITVWPFGTVSFERNSSLSEHATVTLPIVSGLSVAASGSDQDRSGNQVFNTVNGWDAIGYSDSITSFGFQLRLFPGAWTHAEFMSDASANPDGWCWWPSINIGYSRTHDFASYNPPANALLVLAMDMDPHPSNWTVVDQDLDLGSALPLASFLTLEMGYHLNLDETVDGFADAFFEPNDAAIPNEYWQTHLGLRAYWDLWAPGGSDRKGALVPGYGRQGQLVILGTWDYRGSSRSGYVQQWRGLELRTPLTSSLGLGIGAQNIEANAFLAPTGANAMLSDVIDVSWAYTVKLAWAFGSPAHRAGASSLF